jgi:hypothetical protein
MRMKRLLIAGLLGASLVAGRLDASLVAQSGRPASGAGSSLVCDGQCLVATLDLYLNALAARDPRRLPLATMVKFTENTGRMDVGEGLWVGASEAPTSFRVPVVDPTVGQVGFVGLMKEFDQPVLLALRLRVQNRLITEIEHVVARDLNETGLKNLVSPRAGLLEDVKPADRLPRQELLRIANAYFDSIVQNSSKLAPFADDCERRENGMVASGDRAVVRPAAATVGNNAAARIAALSCAQAIDARALSYVTGIDLRRMPVADEQRGLVFALSMFRHRGNMRSITILNVPDVERLPIYFGPVDAQAVHIFKIAGGKLHEIESMGHTLPYKSDAGW